MEFLIYDLKVAVLVAVFYMFYRLLLSRETFHRTNRVVLLATAVASFVLPLCVITLHKTVVVSGGSGLISLDGIGMVEMAEPQTPLWQTLVIVAFFVGLAVTLGHTLVGILKVWRLIISSEHYPQPDGTVICVTDREVSPFSWMHYIVLSQSDYASPQGEDGRGLTSILAHERGHIRQHHSLDVLLVDTLTALQWFNPAMWMLRQDLRAIHEYEADAAVLSQGINMRQYQYLLIQKAVAACGYSVANGITHSTLKNRIHMMLTNKKTNRASWLKLLAMLPIVGAALALNAETVNDYVYKEVQQQPQKKVVKKGKKNAEVKMNNTTIEVKEAKPEVKEEKAEAAPAPEPLKDVKIVMGEAGDTPQQVEIGGLAVKGEPLLVIDGKVATREQLQALDQKTIDHINVVKASEDNKDLRRVYGDKFNADTSNGIIFIITKEYAKSDERKKDYVVVVKKSDKEATATGTPTPTPTEDAKAFDVVEQMPEFPGGMDEMMKFLQTTVKYPEAALKDSLQGRVVASFIIEKDGSVSSPKVLKHVSDDLDAEAIRVIEQMPKWTPGRQKGEAVRVKYTLPITFRLK